MGKTQRRFKRAIIDLDLPVFKAAAVGQKVIYHLYDQHKDYIESFSSAKECKAFIKDATDFQEIDTSGWVRESETVIKDFGTCTKVLDNMVKDMIRIAGADEGRFSIGGEGNFRDEVATLHKYKGQRPSEKPHYLKQLKEYAMEKYKPEVANGIESDDLISIWLFEDFLRGAKLKNRNACEQVMVDLEKDCRVTQGWHIKIDDLDEDGPVWISSLEANRWLFTQCIGGDTADNYKGLKGWGYKKAGEYLEDCKSTKELWSKTLDLYQEFYEKHLDSDGRFPYVTWKGEETSATPEELMIEQLTLAFMMRYDEPDGWKRLRPKENK